MRIDSLQSIVTEGGRYSPVGSFDLSEEIRNLPAFNINYGNGLSLRGLNSHAALWLDYIFLHGYTPFEYNFGSYF